MIYHFKKNILVGMICIFYIHSTITYAQKNGEINHKIIPPFALIKSFPNSYNQNGEYIGLKELHQYCFLPNELEQKNILRAFRQKVHLYQDYLILIKMFAKKTSYPERKAIYLDLYEYYKKNPPENEKLETFMEGFQTSLLDTTDQNKTEYPNSLPFPTIDFDGDKQTDLIAIPSGYFGPSYGFRTYGLVNGTWQVLWSAGGDFNEILKKNNTIILRYRNLTIDETETDVLHNVLYDLDKKQTNYSKFYYADTTELPKKMLEIPLKCSFKPNFKLRIFPKVVNLPIAPKNDEGMPAPNGKCLYGNVTAEFDKPAEGYILAKQGKWFLVAVSPNFEPKKASFWHGMDGYLNEETGQYSDKPFWKPYLLGWVEKQFVK
ncbi:MAG: hypothetical protein EAZ85_13840 [Bacteroidetes bacterium]|nr:MAG: hypothetical protein EAZ85_13840 [Bacteroidota bacterium]TAG87054.1 MAG: hypothetical protein EAZ20_11465 [Bacteroidota bacterium]